MLKNIVSDVRKLVHAGTDCLQAVRKYYAFQNSLSAGESEYGQLNLEKIKLHIELDKTELARRSGMLAEETAKAKAKAEQWGPTVHVNKEELEQVVSGLQAAMQRNPPPAPFPQEFFLKHGKEVSPQEIVEELEEHIKELQDKLRNDTDAAAYQKLVDKLALAENRFQRAVRDCRAAGHARDALHAENVALTEKLASAANAECKLRESMAREEELGARLTSFINQCRELEAQALTDANTILELRKQVESDKKERNRLREILGLEDFAPDAEGIPAHVRGLKGKIKDLTQQLTERDTQAHKNASIISQLRENNAQLERERVGVEKALDPNGSRGARGLVEHALWVMGKMNSLEDKLKNANAQEVRLNVEVQHLKKALAQTTGVPILSATQQVKVE